MRVAAAARSPRQPAGAQRRGDDKESPTLAVQTRSVSREEPSPSRPGWTPIGWLGQVTCTRCAGTLAVSRACVSGADSTGRSSSNNSSNSSVGSSW